MMIIDGTGMVGDDLPWRGCRWRISVGHDGAGVRWDDEHGSHLRSTSYSSIAGRWFLKSVADWTYPPGDPPVPGPGKWLHTDAQMCQMLSFDPDGTLKLSFQIAAERVWHQGTSTGNTFTGQWMDIAAFGHWDDLLNPANCLWPDDPSLDKDLARYWGLEPAPGRTTPGNPVLAQVAQLRPPEPGVLQVLAAGPAHDDAQVLVWDGASNQWVPQAYLRRTWAVPPDAPRPAVAATEEIDLRIDTHALVTAPAETRLILTMEAGIVADCYTDSSAMVRYVETVQATPFVPNPFIDVTPEKDATYVLHPPCPGPALVLRTDARGRLVQALAYRAAPVLGQGCLHPLAQLLGGGITRISIDAMLDAATPTAQQGLTDLAERLRVATQNGASLTVQITASYDGDSSTASGMRVDYTIDGNVGSESYR